MSDQISRIEMTPEENLIWHCARTWREPVAPLDATELDWHRVVEIGHSNRMQTLLFKMLTDTRLLTNLAQDDLETLEAEIARLQEMATLLSDAMHTYLEAADLQGVETVVLKGLSISANVYGDPAVRPGGDIDLLVRRSQVDDSLRIMEELGYGRWWPNLLDDAYYARHHLHQQRCTRDLKVWFEVHWALDHPYTLLTIDYEALMDRATPGQLLGAPVRDLALPDLLLSLAVHLVKHAVYLPSVLDRPDLARIILADGMLQYYLDVAEVIKGRAAEIDWDFTVDLARRSGLVDIFGSVFRVCQEFLAAPVPTWVLEALPVQRAGGLVVRSMHKVADYEVVTFLGQNPSRFWEFMLVTNGAFILRPVRILDAATYFFPGADFLHRRYGSASPLISVRHLFQAAGQYGRLGIDTIRYTVERHRRLKALNESTSLFTRLDVDA
jgi:hypothetical protein